VRLHRIEVKNFRRHEHLAVDLCDPSGKPRSLTLLVGPNMSGKTTVLDAVHLAYEAVHNPKAPSFRPGFDPSDPTQRPDPNEPIEVEVAFSLHEGEWEAMEELERKLGGTLAVKKAPLCRFRLRFRAVGDSEVVDADPPGGRAPASSTRRRGPLHDAAASPPDGRAPRDASPRGTPHSTRG
jgi:AAA domain